MVERGVRALQQAITDACARSGGSCNSTPEGLLSVNADFPPREVVLAIIAAMREPSAEMINAGHAAVSWDGEYTKQRWNAMIDAALAL